jgi:hypothetical protein
MHGSRKHSPPSDIHIRRAEKGFVVRHQYDNRGNGESYRPGDEFAFSSHKEMVAHVSKHLDALDEAEPSGAGRSMPVASKTPPGPRTKGAGVD